MNKNIINILFLWLSTLIAGFINYAYHPIMLKFLSIEEFAEFGSIVWVFNILSVLVWAIWLFIVKEISQDKANNKLHIIIDFWKKELLVLGILMYLLFLVLTPFLSNFLKIDNFIIFSLIWTTIIFSFAWIVFWSFFQAKEKFKLISSIQIIWPIIKLICWVLLVVLWFKIYWAILGLVISQVLLLLLSIFIVFKYIKNIPKKEFTKKELINDFKKDKKQIINYFLSSFILALLMNSDILFAKHFFDETQAGIYAWVSIIAKFSLFIVMSIETVYYPIIVWEKTINKSKIFIISILYILIWICALIFLYFFGEFILNMLKSGFWEYLNLLYLIVIYSVLLWILNFMIKIFIAFKKYVINYLLLLFFVIFIFFLYAFTWKNFYSMIIIFDIFMLSAVLATYLYLWIIKK